MGRIYTSAETSGIGYTTKDENKIYDFTKCRGAKECQNIIDHLRISALTHKLGLGFFSVVAFPFSVYLSAGIAYQFISGNYYSDQSSEIMLGVVVSLSLTTMCVIAASHFRKQIKHQEGQINLAEQHQLSHLPVRARSSSI